MKIAVDYQSTQGKKTGIGVCAEHLMRALREVHPEHDYRLYTHPSERDLRVPQRIFWESFEVPRRACRENCDVIFSPGFAPPLASRKPRVALIHDLIGVKLPHLNPPAARFYWAHWLPFCVRRAQAIITSSESSRRDLVDLLKVPPSQVTAVPISCSPVFGPVSREDWVPVLERMGIKAPYWITVGTLESRKNHARILDAFKLLSESEAGECKLLIVGKDGGQEAGLRSRVTRLGLDKRIHFLGYVEDRILNCLYNGAMGYVFASLYEGFGLPVLEAMKCGKTGIVSQSSSLPEIAGETAWYVRPEATDDIAQKMRLLMNHSQERGRLEALALKRAASFQWEKTAHQIESAFRKVTDERRR